MLICYMILPHYKAGPSMLKGLFFYTTSISWPYRASFYDSEYCRGTLLGQCKFYEIMACAGLSDHLLFIMLRSPIARSQLLF